MADSKGLDHGPRHGDAAFILAPEQCLPGLLCRIASAGLQRSLKTLPDEIDLGGIGKRRRPVQRGQPCRFAEHGRQLTAAQQLIGAELSGSLGSVIGKSLIELPGLEEEFTLQQGFQPFDRKCGHVRATV